MKKFACFLLLSAIAVIMTGCRCMTPRLTEIDDHFFEVAPYTSLDFDYANHYFRENHDNWGGGCSAISAIIDGHRLVGRNMDLNISHKCAYVVRTRIPGKYETFGLMYTFRDFSPDYDAVKKDGISQTFAKILPFLCDDVMNSEGLHIEINMRHGENDQAGNDIFGVEHTNQNAPSRIFVFTLCQYIALNCKTLDDVKNYLSKEVDVYSQKGYWNYCFIISDAEGKAALLEFGNRTYYWTDANENGVIAQTNFYVNEACNKRESIQSGLGRYETLMNEIGTVANRQDLFKLMKKIQYST